VIYEVFVKQPPAAPRNRFSYCSNKKITTSIYSRSDIYDSNSFLFYREYFFFLFSELYLKIQGDPLNRIK